MASTVQRRRLNAKGTTDRQTRRRMPMRGVDGDGGDDTAAFRGRRGALLFFYLWSRALHLHGALCCAVRTMFLAGLSPPRSKWQQASAPLMLKFVDTSLMFSREKGCERQCNPTPFITAFFFCSSGIGVTSSLALLCVADLPVVKKGQAYAFPKAKPR